MLYKAKTIKVLIVENQSLIIDVFKRALNEVSKLYESFNFNINTIKNCESAFEVIKKMTPNSLIDIVLLNINLPPSSTSKLIFVDDIAQELRNRSPKAKLMVFTQKCDNYRISSILKTLDPESIIVNTDIDFKELIHAIRTILIEPPYYSKEVLQFIRRQMTNNFTLDNFDRLILHYLSKGIKMKDLPSLINMSKSGIERRKRILKEVFNVENCNDKALLKIAEEKGII
ncbi:DNA-binding response regulator [Pontimicrobium sp. SW4]|uniref:DNA-binding response regulator n=1 Tax=Pontimicrobium sp. SW4 TaxID=3153519 RepID=A0AAU7BS36_9FLAO